jgi:hypothetical protein
MQAFHYVRNVRLQEVGNTPQGLNQWIVLDFDMEETMSLCFYVVPGSQAEKKLLAIASLLNNWPPSAEPLPAEDPVGDPRQSAPAG